MPYSTANGVRTWYEVAGEGPPALLIHANPCDHRMWLYQTAHFSARYRCTALDLRAYGKSDQPVESYDFADVIADVAGVAEQTDAMPAVVFGASIGSKIALQYALDYPDRVRALVLVGGSASRSSSYDARIEGYRTQGVPAYRPKHIAELFAPGFVDTERGRYLADMLCEGSDKLSGDAIAHLFASFEGVGLDDRVAEIDLPVLIVNGAHDNSLTGGRNTAALIPGARHEIIPDAGHLCILERPAAFDAIVSDFLGSLPDA